MAEGAERAGRATPRLSAIVPVALERPDRDPTELVVASNSRHMRAPHYIDMLRKAGIDIAGEELPAAAKRMLEGDAFVHGTIDAIVEKLTAYREAGADEIVLNLTGVYNVHGPKAAMDDLKQILTAVTA
nr:hypothetical protein [Streptomyces sp. Alain-F2R5]